MASLRFMALLCVLCSSVLITNGLTAEEEQAALEEEIFQETLAAGRGEREAQGVRDQWEVKSGIGGKEDTRKPISKKVRSMMEDNGLSCPGCSHKEAVAMVNAFIKEEQKRLAYEEQLEQLAQKATPVLLLIVGAVVVVASVYVGLMIGDSGAAERGKLDAEIKDEILKTQTYAEAMAMARGEAPINRAPTWREREEAEIWTPKQEKQFQKALAPLLGLPPKERWPLVAEKVDDKTKGECAAHYKLQGILEQEARDQAPLTIEDVAGVGAARRRKQTTGNEA